MNIVKLFLSYFLLSKIYIQFPSPSNDCTLSITISPFSPSSTPPSSHHNTHLSSPHFLHILSTSFLLLVSLLVNFQSQSTTISHFHSPWAALHGLRMGFCCTFLGWVEYCDKSWLAFSYSFCSSWRGFPIHPSHSLLLIKQSSFSSSFIPSTISSTIPSLFIPLFPIFFIQISLTSFPLSSLLDPFSTFFPFLFLLQIYSMKNLAPFTLYILCIPSTLSFFRLHLAIQKSTNFLSKSAPSLLLLESH